MGNDSMKLISVAAALFVAMTGVAAYAQEATATQEPAPERKICRTEKMTGSLTRRTRICLTEREWRELNARTRRGVGEMQGEASGGTPPAQNPATAPGAGL
jgi:hypothetical protein